MRHTDMPSMDAGAMPNPMIRRVKTSMTSITQWLGMRIDSTRNRSTHQTPGRTIGARLGSKVYGKHAKHDIFFDFDAKSVIDLLGNADTTELWIAALHLDDGRDELGGRASRSGLSLPMGRGEQQTVFSMDQRLVEFDQRGRLDYRG
jgi:hypothetical protein